MTETLRTVIVYINYAILLYVFFLMSTYLLLSFLSFFGIKRYFRKTSYYDRRNIFSSLNHIPISVIVPAYNEQNGIVENVKSLLQLEYPEFQLVVVNDGSKDSTLEALLKNFNTRQISFKPWYNLKSEKIRAVYVSTDYPNLIVVDKENGGKADAINAGVNIAKHPLVTVIDADSILERDCLLKIVVPFLEDKNVVAVGGTIRIANGCEIEQGNIKSVGLPKSILAKFQVVEYIRAFIFGRTGFERINSLLIVSGAFSCFVKETVIDIGGFKTGSIGEDMEIIVRMHKELRKKNPKMKITFVPDPVCWTEAPENFKILKSQRTRWQKGTLESILAHKELLFNPRYKLMGLIGFPYYFFIEMLGPLIEILGYVIFIISVLFGWVSYYFAIVFLCVAILYGIIISILSIILEEISFTKYPKLRHLIEMLFLCVLENFGYRQLTTLWRFSAIIEYAFGKRKWEKMEKKGFQKVEEKNEN